MPLLMYVRRLATGHLYVCTSVAALNGISHVSVHCTSTQTMWTGTRILETALHRACWVCSDKSKQAEIAKPHHSRVQVSFAAVITTTTTTTTTTTATTTTTTATTTTTTATTATTTNNNDINSQY